MIYLNSLKLNAAQRVSNASHIPIDMITSMPYIKMCSNREITVEDAGKLLHYDRSTVKVRQRKTSIIISGSGLDIKCLANNDLRVEGCIYGVSFEK